MDTLNTPLPATAPLPTLHWRAMLGRLTTALRAPSRSDEDRFLGDASDLGDLERRQRVLERDGLPLSGWPTR